METLTTNEGRVISLPYEQDPLWKYSGFKVVEFYAPRGVCGKCHRSIVYCYFVSHQEYGVATVGMECLRSVLGDKEMLLAMREFREASSKISQHRFKARIAKVRKKIPSGFLDVMMIETSRGSFSARYILDHLDEKLVMHVFLASKELEMLQMIERRVG